MQRNECEGERETHVRTGKGRGIAKTHMLWLFLALYARNRKQVSTDEIARVIAVYERRAPQIESALKYL